MAKRLKIPISKARSSLFRLADLVRKSDGSSVVVLEQRGESEQVALVREARLAYLEERVALIEREEPVTFRLGGSLASKMSDEALEQAFRELRLEWSAPAARQKTRAPAGGKRRPAASRRT
jgi:hypothetical protein